MTSNFLRRNRRKGILASLLLFLRENKAAAVLLLLVLLASGLVLGPSSMLVRMPGGARVAAGIAWLAQSVGIDTSLWGFGPVGTHSYSDMLASFNQAKATNAVGWGALFRKGGRNEGNVSSLDLIQKNAALEAANAARKLGGVAATQNETVQGIVNPDDPNERWREKGVALDAGDVRGEREGWLKSAFAGGFMSGLLGGTDGGGNAAGGGVAGGLSGGAFAGKGFFGGKGGAAGGKPGDSGKGALDGLTPMKIPPGRIQSASAGRLSYKRAQQINSNAVAGQAAASSFGSNHAFFQLAEGKTRASMVTEPGAGCAPNCPPEVAATNTGANYDGNAITGAGTGLLNTGIDPAVPNIPSTTDAQNAENQAAQMQADMKKCQDLDAQYNPQEQVDNQKMQDLQNQFTAAQCGSGGCDKGKVSYCQSLGDQMRTTSCHYQSLMCAHHTQCPLTANTFNCSNECQQVGNGIDAQPIHVAATTGGNTNAAGMSSVDPCPPSDNETQLQGTMDAAKSQYDKDQCSASMTTYMFGFTQCSKDANALKSACVNYFTVRCQRISGCPQMQGTPCDVNASCSSYQ